jgi:hypothetical protein
MKEFWDMDPAARDQTLFEGIAAAHAFHYERNTAYRNTVAARGVGRSVLPGEMPRLLRNASQTFTSYVDILGTPFPQDQPAAFTDWLADQVSVDLNPDKHRFRDRYRSLEGLLKAIEREYNGLGLELLATGGPLGPTTIVPRDRTSAGLAADSFQLCFQRYLDIGAEHIAIFMMPKRTRAPMVRTARSGLQRIGLPPESVHFATRFPARPDQLRVRAGLTYRPGLRGDVERYVSHPLMTALQDRLVDARAVESAIARLIPASAHEEKVLLFGSLGQLHAMAAFLLDSGRTITLAPGSLLGTDGLLRRGWGVRTAGGKTPAEMREDLRQAFRLTDGGPAAVRDIYSVAAANWVAVQCSHGNYHIPPWVHAVTLDDQEEFQTEPRSTGTLAFFDPYGGGELFPAFFRTADRVTLVRAGACPCGERGSYLEEDSLRPVDPIGEAG